MVSLIRKLLIGMALGSWALLVLGLVGGLALFDAGSGTDGLELFPGGSGTPSLVRHMVLWVLPGALFLHGAAAVVVLWSESEYARAWALGLVASALGQVGVVLVFLSLADKLADFGMPIF